MYGLEVCNIRVGGAVVDYKGYLSTLAFKLPVLLSYPILKKLAVHPAFFCARYLQGRFRTPLKHLGFFDLQVPCKLRISGQEKFVNILKKELERIEK